MDIRCCRIVPHLRLRFRYVDVAPPPPAEHLSGLLTGTITTALGLTVRRAQLDPVGRGRPMRSPFDAELVVFHLVGLNVGHVQVHCRGRNNASD